MNVVDSKTYATLENILIVKKPTFFSIRYQSNNCILYVLVHVSMIRKYGNFETINNVACTVTSPFCTIIGSFFHFL